MCLFLSLLPTNNNVAAFSVGEEKEVGEKLLYAVKRSFPVLEDPDLIQYIMRLGDDVIHVAGVQFFDYHFFIIDNKEFNAFAAPSGLIFFHSGLIEKVNSENELVSVLAHEVGHVVKRHISSRIDKGQKISIATMGLILASLAFGGGAGTEALFTGAVAAGQSANLHFSRIDEEEADLLAYDWMKKLGRHPDGQVKMLQTMRQIARYRSGMIPQYLLTHPNPESRLHYVQTLIESEEEELQSLKEGDDTAFLRFKYRVLSQVKDTMYLRGLFSSILSSPKSDNLHKIMAEYGNSLLESRENNYKQSLALINKVIQEFPAQTLFLVDKGIILYESGEIESAFSVLEKAYNSNREDMYATFSLAKVCFSLGKIDRAESLFKDVMYRFPKYSKAYFELGKLNSQKGLPAFTQYYLGKYYLYEGKLKLSKKNLQSALKTEKLPEELILDVKRTLDTIKRLEKNS